MRRHHLLLGAQALLVGVGGAFVALSSAAPPAQVVVAQAPPSSVPVEREVEPRADRYRSEPARVATEPTAPAAPAAPPAPAPAPEPPTAPPPAPPAPACEADPQARGERVLATLPDAWRSTGMPIHFSGPRAGYFGEVRTDQWVVHVYVRSCGAQSDAHLRHILAHELGHAHDVSFLSDAAREEYKRARGIPASTPWFGCSGCPDLVTPAGDYAEVYGQWLRGGTTNNSQLAPDAGSRALVDLAARFFSIA